MTLLTSENFTIKHKATLLQHLKLLASWLSIHNFRYAKDVHTHTHFVFDEPAYLFGVRPSPQRRISWDCCSKFIFC